MTKQSAFSASSPQPPVLARTGAALGEGGLKTPHVEGNMDGSGIALRSRGYQVRILAAARKSRRQPIPNVLKPGTMLVPLTQGRFAIIDEGDASAVSQHSWCAAKATLSDSLFYATAKIAGKVVKLHKFLWELWGRQRAGLDHINGDGLDNRRSNLRAATQSQNLANSRMFRTNTSGYRGVSRFRGKWVAQIRINGTVVHIGRFDTAELASAAYKQTAQALHGEFARAS